MMGRSKSVDAAIGTEHSSVERLQSDVVTPTPFLAKWPSVQVEREKNGKSVEYLQIPSQNMNGSLKNTTGGAQKTYSL